MKNKIVIFSKKGFTLIEMLLVIAIIGILAGAVYAMIGDSSDAKTKSALSTAKSIMPYAQECLFKGNDLETNPTIGGPICIDSETNWPSIGPTECTYDTGSATTWIIQCALSAAVSIDCDAQDGECVVN